MFHPVRSTTPLIMASAWLLMAVSARPLAPKADMNNGGAAFAPLVTLQPYVTKAELTDLENGFMEHILAGPDAAHLEAIEQPDSYIKWQDLKDLLDTLIAHEAVKADMHGVRVLYGLTENAGSGPKYRFAYAVQLVSLYRQGTDFPTYKVEVPADPKYFCSVGMGSLTPITAPWTPGDLYGSKTCIKRYQEIGTGKAGVPNLFVDGFDTRSYTFSWEDELQKLYAANAGGGATYLQVRCTAEPLVVNKIGRYDIRHHLCAVMLDASMEQMISDVPLSDPFAMKAADIGSPCPALCGTICFYPHGVEVVKDWDKP